MNELWCILGYQLTKSME